MIGIYRKHDLNPFEIVLVHGGPGAAGTLYDLCENLSEKKGVIEMLHEGKTIEEQIAEINDAVKEECEQPIILAGHSWGAWLVIYYAAQFPEKVKRLILISSGPFEEEYIAEMNELRQDRFSEEDLKKLGEYFKKMNACDDDKADEYFQKAGELFHKTDSYDEESVDLNGKTKIDKEVYEKVWAEAAEKRKKGELMQMLKAVKCPITVIHGDYDPHPYRGVKNPVMALNKEAEFFLLSDCGHIPWREKAAKEEFYSIVKERI